MCHLTLQALFVDARVAVGAPLYSAVSAQSLHEEHLQCLTGERDELYAATLLRPRRSSLVIAY